MSFLSNLIHEVADANSPAAVTTILILVCATLYFIVFRRGPYDHIPAIGSNNFFLSYIDAFRYVVRGPQVLQEGYNKFSKNEGIFRIPTMTGWLVVVCGDKLIEEIRSLKGEEELSAEMGARVFMSGDYTLGRQIYENPYHMPILRTRLTKNLDTWFEPIKAEIAAVFEEFMPSTKDWSSIKLYPSCVQVVARSVNSVIVSDTNIYRDPEYVNLIMGFTLDTALGAFILTVFPKLLKPFARTYLTNIPRAMATMTQFLRDTIQARQAKIDEYGRDYPDKPNDILSFCMDVAEGKERTEESLALRTLMVNFAATHTTSMVLSIIMRDLAERPEYVEPLREEIESVISKYGWTKASLAYMHKLESFIMESQRLKTSRAITSNRWCMKDHVLSNGVRIPKNTMVVIAMRARHYDSAVFDNPYKFDGLRFYKTEDHNNNNDNTTRNFHLTSPNSKYLLFGVGEHICPGRFFAANMLKTALAHFLLNYDAQLDPNNKLPRDSWFGSDLLSNNNFAVLVRERKIDG